MAETVTLISAEGDRFAVDVGVAVMSVLIRNMLEDGGTGEAIPLPNVSSDTLKKVIAYMEYHKDNPPAPVPKPLKSARLEENGVCEFDIEFINIESDQVHAVILAANYMDLEPLLELGCTHIAAQIKAIPPGDLRKQFNVTKDFTPEEEQKIRDENPWAAGVFPN